MRNNILLFHTILLLMGSLLVSCNSNPSRQDESTTKQPPDSTTSQLDGSWELVWEKVDGKARTDGKVSQFKMFHDGFFSLIMQDSSGKWSLAGSGTYSLDGTNYKETFRYCSVPEFVGVTDWQEYQLTGDTLYSKGFSKVLFGNGEDKTSGFPKFEEKRIRAKR